MKNINEMNPIELFNLLNEIKKTVDENIKVLPDDSIMYCIETDEEKEYVVGIDGLKIPIIRTVLTTDNINEALVFRQKEDAQCILKIYPKFKVKKISRQTFMIQE